MTQVVDSDGFHGRSGGGVLSDAVENVRDPCGCASGIRRQCGAVGRRQVPAQLCDDVVIHGAFANPAKGKDDMRAFRILCGNKSWGYVAKDDFRFAASDASTRAGSEVPTAHRHLIAEAKHVGRVSTSGEHVAAGLAMDEILHGIVAWAE